MDIDANKETIKTQTDKFPCPSCGGGMVFDPSTQALSCLYCGNKIEIKKQEGEIQEYNIDSVDEMDSADWGNDIRTIHCNSCGAETVLKEENIAQFCVFCGSSHIVKQEEISGIKPESLVPFKIGKERAKEFFKKWIKGKFFAPKKVKDSHKLDKLTGVYIPHWTYDSDTYSSYTGEKGTYYYVTRTQVVNGKRVQKRERRIRWQYVSGAYDKYYNDVLVNASRHVDAQIMSKIEPFNLEGLEHYEPEYLSGFTAQRYTVGLDEGWEVARHEINNSIYSGVVRKIGGDQVRNVHINTSYKNILFKHILLPVWMSSYSFKGKIYRFMVNGQTGEVQGNSPISPIKVALTVLISLGVIGGIVAFLVNR